MNKLTKLAEEWAKEEAQHLGINHFADHYERQRWIGIAEGAYECGLRAGLEMAAAWVEPQPATGYALAKCIRALLDAKEGKE